MVTDMDIITPKDAAAIVGIQYKSILEAIYRGRLRAQKVGRSYLIRRDDLAEYQASRQKRKQP